MSIHIVEQLRPLSKIFLLGCGLIVFTAAHCLAQDTTSQNSDLIREKIEAFEKIELQSKSTNVQEIYKRTLFRLYKQYVSALQQDAADLKKLQSAIGQTNPESQKEISAQLQKLATEQSLTSEKIKTLGETNGDRAGAETNANGSDGLAPKAALAGADETKPATRKPTTNSVPSAATDDTATITLCGQIKPASLLNILALVESNADAFPQTVEMMTGVKTGANAFKHSTLKDNCEPDSSVKVGDQKDAVTAVLSKFLDELADLDKHPDRKAAIERHGPGLGDVSRETVKREILLLNGYIGNSIVHVDKDGDTAKYTPRADKDGNYSVEVPAGTYSISTEADNDNTKRTVVIHTGDDSVRIDIPIEDRPVSLLSRALVGYEQAGAAAAKSSQNYLFDLFVSKSFPVRQKIDPDFGERLRTWIDFRFGSVPQTGDVTIGDFATGFATQVKSLKVKDAARVLEFMGGIEYRLTGNAGLLPSFDRLTKQKFSISLIAGGGFTTPTNPLDSISIFKVPVGGIPGFPQTVGKDFVAFIQSDRDRFFRQYYVGLRMQTFFFNLFNMPMQRFPAQLDVAVGQNEFVTGGKLAGPVVRIDGFFPLPYDGLKFVNIFGTAMLRPGHSTIGTPLVLQTAPDGTVVPAANAVIIAVPQPNRDYYRFGFGIDLVSLVKKWAQSNSTAH